MLKDEVNKLAKEAEQAVADADDLNALEQLRVQYLGKKGSITALMKSLGKLTAEERPQAGQIINEAKQSVQAAIEERKTILASAKLNAQLEKEVIDVTLPGRQAGQGGLHPVTRTGLPAASSRDTPPQLTGCAHEFARYDRTGLPPERRDRPRAANMRIDQPPTDPPNPAE